MKREISRVIADVYTRVATERGAPPTGTPNGNTRLFGPGSPLDSVALVSLIAEVEQILEDEYGVSMALADERAMSRKRSPFRTIESLAEYATELLSDLNVRA